MNAPWNRAGDMEPREAGAMLTYAIDNAQCWEDQPEAKALTAEILFAEQVAAAYDQRKHLSYWADDIRSQIEELKDRLFTVREREIGRSFPEDSDPDGYGFDRASAQVPTVDEALDTARRNQVAPFNNLPCLGAAARGPQL